MCCVCLCPMAIAPLSGVRVVCFEVIPSPSTFRCLFRIYPRSPNSQGSSFSSQFWPVLGAVGILHPFSMPWWVTPWKADDFPNPPTLPLQDPGHQSIMFQSSGWCCVAQYLLFCASCSILTLDGCWSLQSCCLHWREGQFRCRWGL